MNSNFGTVITLTLALACTAVYAVDANVRDLPATSSKSSPTSILVTAQPQHRSTGTQRTISLKTYRNSPLAITAIKVGTTDILPGRAFNAEDGWLSRLSVKVKNISERQITYAEIEVMTPGTGDIQNGLSKLQYGVWPAVGNETGRRNDNPLLPGQEVILTYNASQLLPEDSRVANVHFSLGCEFYDNDPTVMWHGGKLMRRDDANPHRYNVIDTPAPISHKTNFGYRIQPYAPPISPDLKRIIGC